MALLLRQYDEGKEHEGHHDQRDDADIVRSSRFSIKVVGEDPVGEWAGKTACQVTSDWGAEAGADCCGTRQQRRSVSSELVSIPPPVGG